MKTMTRLEAIDDIRRVILTLVDDEHSMCQTAARLGIYCRGFKQYTDAELFERYQWIVQRQGVTKREDLEDLANRWQLARQFVQNKKLSCDVQCEDKDSCGGWDGFSNDQLVEFHRKICGEDVIIRK